MKSFRLVAPLSTQCGIRTVLCFLLLAAVMGSIETGLGAQLSPEIVAGTGEVGFQDGPAAQAKFSDEITAMAVDAAGNVFMVDRGNLRVRKIGVDGMVTTLAAGALESTNMAGTSVNLGVPYGLAQGQGGDLYVSDWFAQGGWIPAFYNRVLRITPQGEITLVTSRNTFFGNDPFEDVAWISDEKIGYLMRGLDRHAQWKEIHELNATGADKTVLARPVFVPFEADWLTIRSLAATPSGDYCFTQRQSDGTDWIVRLTPSGAPTIAFKRSAGINALAVGPQGETYVVAGSSPTNGAVAQIVSPDTLEMLYASVSLGGTLAVSPQGILYAVESNRVVRLSYPPGGIIVQTSSSGGGSVTVSPAQATYPLQSEITLSATPLPGWQFLGWTGGVTGNISPLTLTLRSNLSAQANFGTPLRLTGSHVSFTTNPELAAYPYGSQVTFTAVPDSGYLFKGWADGVADIARSAPMTNAVGFQPVIEPDLRFTSSTPMEVNLIRMSLEGVAGKSILVSYSDDLKTWNPYVVLQLNAQRTAEFAVVRENHPRFYRAQFVE